MMKAILGSALGGAVAGAVALVAAAQAPEPTWDQRASSAAPYAMTVANGSGAAGPGQGATAVQCDPHQEAVLQRGVVNGREVAQVTCVDRMMLAPAAPGYAAAAYAQPQVVYAPPVHAPAAPDIVQRPVVRTAATRTRSQRVVYQRDEAPKRSWKKSALIIGGAAGAGAGVGALAGGKKGALIGAAIGGGSGAIYEAVKRK